MGIWCHLRGKYLLIYPLKKTFTNFVVIGNSEDAINVGGFNFNLTLIFFHAIYRKTMSLRGRNFHSSALGYSEHTYANVKGSLADAGS